MKAQPREDIEHLLRIDHVPAGLRPIYDTGDEEGGIGYRIQTHEIQIPPPHIFEGNRVPGTIIYELRANIVASILSVRARVEQRWRNTQLNPFTLAGAHEIMANRDLCLRAFLVNTEFAPLLERVSAEPWWGVKTALFTHDDIPPAEVYGFAEPAFVGVVSICGTVVGSAICNPAGVLWGRFARRHPGV